MKTKTEVLMVRLSPNEKRELETVAKNLKLSMSDLFRNSVDVYIDHQIGKARNAFLSRAKPFLTHDNPTQAIAEVERLLDGMTLDGLRTWGDPDVTPGNAFEMFVDIKLKAEAVPA